MCRRRLGGDEYLDPTVHEIVEREATRSGPLGTVPPTAAPLTAAATSPKTRPGPRVENDPLFGNNGRAFEQVEHLVSDDDLDTSLCGVDQTDVPWDQGWPLCEACRAISSGRMT